MSDHEHKGGRWAEIAITAIISILLTSGVWNVLTQEKPNRAEVKSMIRELKDDIMEGQRENRQAIKDLGAKVDAWGRAAISEGKKR